MQEMSISNKTEGYISNIQHFSIHDGPGVRTTIFFSGCSLRCKWCANPETWEKKENEKMSLMTMLEIVNSQAIFHRTTEGGITFSGGEATLQYAFLNEATAYFYKLGKHLTLETCGDFDFEKMRSVLRRFDLVYFDIKHMDIDLHQQLTGKGNMFILENLVKCIRLGINIVVRIPVIDPIHTEEVFCEKVISFFKNHMISSDIELLPFHRFGDKKYDHLGLSRPDDGYHIPTQLQLEHMINCFKENKIHAYVSHSDSNAYHDMIK